MSQVFVSCVGLLSTSSSNVRVLFMSRTGQFASDNPFKDLYRMECWNVKHTAARRCECIGVLMSRAVYGATRPLKTSSLRWMCF
jgi:hypothetical protein